ncbi:MAG: beta-galactosidase trimerization domain-containing protein [Lachnospiraceae bacterium]|nr:beta-galactosidase trimerization domain-containing protein [Lachnospiraceae bacterium]
MEELRFRQIHLDFHTSEKIAGIGKDFRKEEFAEMLKNAHVDSITCFARGHHGMLYYRSARFPELIHPGLEGRTLLEDQIEACHKLGIRVPVYETVQWDYRISQEHPEWLCLNADGSIVDFCQAQPSPVYEPGFYRTLCVNTPYRDFLKAHLEDLFQVVGAENIDGIFLDITNIVDCSCRHCVEGMIKKGYHPDKKADRIRYAKEMREGFMTDMTDFIKRLKPDATIFYNSSHVGPQLADIRKAYTHWELESLPSGGWGYSHFANSVRYARTTGMDYLAHTGKFHTSWGDFHSFKNKEALQYECFRMLAYNSKCLIGDQLNPDGKLEQAVYDLIGPVYGEVERKEPWCRRARVRTDLALYTSEDLHRETDCCLGGSVPLEVNGACTMLDELGIQFDVVDRRVDFNQYEVLVLPDTILCDEELTEKLKAYLAAGGKLIATGQSGLKMNGIEFALPELGVKYKGEAPYSPDFLMPNEKIGKELPKTEHVMYDKGIEVEVLGGEVLADVYVPYFNRTWEHFCSHKHTPSSHKKGYPGIVRKQNCIYFMHPIFTTYQEWHPRWCREFLKDALDLLLQRKYWRWRDRPQWSVPLITKRWKTEMLYICCIIFR